jgi:hypothetical protein
MRSFGNWGVQSAIGGLPGALGVSPKTGGFRGLKSVSKRSQIYHYD